MQSMEDRKRNIAYDLVKFILSFFVVAIHFSTNKDLIAFSRISVPVFFMISGYLCEKTNLNKNERLARIKKLHKSQIKYALLFIPCLVYEIITSILNIKMVNSCITPFWFIVALILITGVYYYLVLHDKEKILPYLIIPLLFCNILFGSYSTLLLRGGDPFLELSRNALFCGLPFYTIGLYFRKFPFKLSAISKVAMFFVFIVFGFLQIFERRYLFSCGDTIGDLYITSIISSIALFLLTINTNLQISAEKYNKFIGNNFTYYIYCFHKVIGDILLHFNISSVFIIFVSTSVFAYILHILQLFLKKHKVINLFKKHTNYS